MRNSVNLQSFIQEENHKGEYRPALWWSFIFWEFIFGGVFGWIFSIQNSLSIIGSTAITPDGVAPPFSDSQLEDASRHFFWFLISSQLFVAGVWLWQRKHLWKQIKFSCIRYRIQRRKMSKGDPVD